MQMMMSKLTYGHFLNLDTAAPAAPTVGRSSGRQRRKTWRALEAAEESAESDSSAESPP